MKKTGIITKALTFVSLCLFLVGMLGPSKGFAAGKRVLIHQGDITYKVDVQKMRNPMQLCFKGPIPRQLWADGPIGSARFLRSRSGKRYVFGPGEPVKIVDIGYGLKAEIPTMYIVQLKQ